MEDADSFMQIEQAAEMPIPLRRRAFAEIMAKHEGLFEPPPDPNLVGYNITSGKILDPQKQDIYRQQLQEQRSSGLLSFAEYTRHLDALNRDGSVLAMQSAPAITPTPTVSPTEPKKEVEVKTTGASNVKRLAYRY